MSRYWLWTLVALACFAGSSLAGCDGGQPVVSDTGAAAVEGARIGEAVELGDGLSVTLVSADTTLPDSLESSPAPSPHWMLFEVTNSSDSSATFPGRPQRPTIVDANGNPLRVPGIRAELVDGGGGWGPAAPQLGQPYVNPGGMMRVWCELPEWPTAKRPLTITYAPTQEGSAVFVIE